MIKKGYEIKNDVINALNIEVINKIGKEYLLNYYPINEKGSLYVDKNTLMNFIDFSARIGITNLLYCLGHSEESIIGHNSCMFAYIDISNGYPIVKYSKLYNIW